jgi:hypothetical protein
MNPKQASGRGPGLNLYASIGVCLLYVQMAEKVINGSSQQVFGKQLTIGAKSESEQKRTLGALLIELRTQTDLPRDFRDKLYTFLRMRNDFVHDFTKISGDLQTQAGQDAALKFLIDLLFLAHEVMGVFISTYTISAREEFGEDMINNNRLLRSIEETFGPAARRLLAARRASPKSKP